MLVLVGRLPRFPSPVHPQPLPLMVSHSHPASLFEQEDTLFLLLIISSGRDSFVAGGADSNTGSHNGL